MDPLVDHVSLYNSTICRLCGEENENGTFLFPTDGEEDLSVLINSYLPLKVSDDGQMPRTVCPGCEIQLEACVEFFDLIIKGQKIIRELHQSEKEFQKKSAKKEDEYVLENVTYVYEISTADGVFQVEHPIALQVAGLEKPKRKRGRPPKKPKTAEDLAKEEQELALKHEMEAEKLKQEAEPSGKRRRKAPTRFKEVVQGKELEKILKEEGLTDGEDSDSEVKPESAPAKAPEGPQEPQVIGMMEASGEMVEVIVVKKGRGRPKGRLQQKKQECAICGMEFSCVGRYMSHVAQHGPVLYECTECRVPFATRILFTEHQAQTGHQGQNVQPCKKDNDENTPSTVPNRVVETNIKKEVQAATEKDPLAVPRMKVLHPIKDTPDMRLSESVDKRSITDSPVDVDTSSPNTQVINDVMFIIEKASDSPISFMDKTAIEEDNNIEVETKPIQEIEQGEHEIVQEQTSVEQEETEVEQGDTEVEQVETEVVQGQDEIVQGDELGQEDDVVPGKKRLKCLMCDKTFGSKQSKSLHMKAIHKNERPYECKVCGAAFAYPRSLTLHSVRHRRCVPSKGYACDLCGKVLNHPSSVVYHKEAEHAGHQYSCIKCDKTFKHKQLLQRHQLVHTEDRPYTCSICDSTFKTRANLVNHQLLHTGVRKYKCEICKQRFAHKTSLTLHLRLHTGVKPFACKVCGKAFSQKGNLSEHERIHTGVKPYSCDQCGRCFTTSSQRRHHAARHAETSSEIHRVKRRATARAHGSKAMRCDKCRQYFPDHNCLIQHQLLKHRTPEMDADMNNSITEAIISTECSQTQSPDIVFVTFEDDDSQQQIAMQSHLEDTEIVSSNDIYPGPSLLLQAQSPQSYFAQTDDNGDTTKHIAITDEDGNPVQLSVQDGQRLLQALAREGQSGALHLSTIQDMEQLQDYSAVVQEINVTGKSMSEESPDAHYYTIV